MEIQGNHTKIISRAAISPAGGLYLIQTKDREWPEGLDWYSVSDQENRIFPLINGLDEPKDVGIKHSLLMERATEYKIGDNKYLLDAQIANRNPLDVSSTIDKVLAISDIRYNSTLSHARNQLNLALGRSLGLVHRMRRNLLGVNVLDGGAEVTDREAIKETVSLPV